MYECLCILAERCSTFVCSREENSSLPPQATSNAALSAQSSQPLRPQAALARRDPTNAPEMPKTTSLIRTHTSPSRKRLSRPRIHGPSTRKQLSPNHKATCTSRQRPCCPRIPHNPASCKHLRLHSTQTQTPRHPDTQYPTTSRKRLSRPRIHATSTRKQLSPNHKPPTTVLPAHSPSQEFFGAPSGV